MNKDIVRLIDLKWKGEQYQVNQSRRYDKERDSQEDLARCTEVFIVTNHRNTAEYAVRVVVMINKNVQSL